MIGGKTIDDPDVRIMLRYKNGDEKAFEEIFRKYKKPMVNYLYRMVGNEGRAEELAQDVFLKVAEGRRRYEPLAKLSTWLFRIATNVALNERRREEYRSAHTSLDAVEEPGHTARGDMTTGGKEMDEIVKKAVAGLPDTQRAALLLCTHEEMSYRDIGLALSVSEKAVKSLVHRARESLRKTLKGVL